MVLNGLHRPMSTITSSSPIEYIVSGSGEDYMDLNNTILEVKACIKTTNDSPADAAVAVAPRNNTLHSPFSQIDVSLNDVNVSSATTTYPYRAYIETHLNYGTDAKNQAAMYFIDDNLTVSNPIPDSLQSYT